MFVLFLIFGVINAAQDLKGMCRLDPHPSVEYRCLIPNSEGTRPCGIYEPTDTYVSPKCRKPNYYSTSSLPFMRCFEGYWDYIARCIPECGRLTPDGKELVVGGRSVKRGELPWHAGIYKKTRSPYLQVCGGSLISTNVVISAAHCFWNDLEKQLPAFQYAVAVGKVFRQWNNNLDEAQKSNVKAIHLPPRYQGAGANHQEDVAVVIVSKEFKYKTYIRPVCLSFDYDFERQQLQAGNLGKVAGWGLTAANSTRAANELQVVDLPYVPVGTCIADSPPVYREFITGDKICAGTLTSDTALCRGDSGGGLVFPETYRRVERYYLRGIVSTAPSSDNACNTDTYTSFTHIIKHEHFIKQFWTETGQFKCLDGSFITAANHCDGARDCADGSDETARTCSRKSCSSYLFQCAYGACVDKGATCNGVEDCADGSDEVESLCGKSTLSTTTISIQAGNRCLLPPYPKHGSYVVTNIAGAKPGEIYDLVTLNITCEPGFLTLGSGFIYCFKGLWQDSLPECTNEFRKDYTYYSSAGGWFKIHPIPVDWRTAGLLCHYEGAELASPRSPEMRAVLNVLIAKAVPKLQVYYSGVRHIPVDEAIKLDIPLKKQEYFWNINDKKTGPEQCSVYSSDVVERDFNCEDPLPYVCFRKFKDTDQITECGTVDKAYKLHTSTGHCYKFHERAEPWERALKICRVEGGDLAIVNSKAEADILSNLLPLPNSSVAIGFREWGQADSWWTVHGQTLEEAGFEEWRDESPNLSSIGKNGKACGGLSEGQLIDISCDVPLAFVCEKTRDSIITQR